MQQKGSFLEDESDEDNNIEHKAGKSNSSSLGASVKEIDIQDKNSPIPRAKSGS